MKCLIWLAIFLAAPAIPQAARRAAGGARHVIVFQQDGRFGGWPANHGVWQWGNEIVVGFEDGKFKDNPTGHDIDYSEPAEHVLARSLDGGETWAIERPEGLKPPPNTRVASVPTPADGRPLMECPGGIRFTHPDFAMTLRMTSINDGESRFYYTYDRGKSWEGPFRLPNFGQPGIAARTDYLVRGEHDLIAFVTAAKSNRGEGRVITIRTRDGGRTWNMVSFIGPEPLDYAIMPSTVEIGPGVLFTAIRRRRWIDTYRSFDDGESWHFVNQPVLDIGGNPPSLVRLRDGRLVMTYGYRLEPFGIRAKISADQGRSWGEEIILRQDGGGTDLGYTRTVERPDGKLVTVYYYNTDPHAERFIAATIWEPR